MPAVTAATGCQRNSIKGPHMVEVEKLREVFSYDAETGILTWRDRVGNVAAGSVAGRITNKGYIQIGVCGKRYMAHRLAWAYVHGYWPNGDIDHIDGDRLNNRIANLRDVSRAVNSQNERRARSSNKSCGLLGVSASLSKWRALIRVDGKKLYIGTFDTPKAAHEAYLSAKRELHEGCTI